MAGDDKVSDWSRITENNWFSISVALVVIGCVLSIFVSGWIISAKDLVLAKNRLDLVMPLATIYLALITFCTVAWRGLVGARQADQQKAQNDANDDANYAKLLQEGAKLLGDSSKPHDQLAGLTTLEVVIYEPKKRFSSQALDMIANFYTSRHKNVSDEEASNYTGDVVTNLARVAINKASESGMRSSIKALFTAETSKMYWKNVNGFQHQRYEGGSIRNEELEGISKDKFSVRDAVITKIDFPYSSGHFDKCVFKYCAIREIDEFIALFDQHKFENCNFSGCHFTSNPADLDDELKLLDNENWYDVDNPPFFEGGFDWSRILKAKKKNASGFFTSLHGDDIPF